METIDVSAGIIFRDGKLLITQRHEDSHLGGLWEFPGGKREAGETFEECLVRELGEELGADITVGRFLERVTHEYPERTVHLNFYLCHLTRDEPRTVGCAALRWVSRSELQDYSFPPADARLLSKLRQDTQLWTASG